MYVYIYMAAGIRNVGYARCHLENLKFSLISITLCYRLVSYCQCYRIKPIYL